MAVKKEEEEVNGGGGGELLYCGVRCWEDIGKRNTSIKTWNSNLVSPTRLLPLLGVDIRLVVSGCASYHCIALDVEGRCYTWGRNEKGQLGHGDTIQRDRPTIVSKLSKYKIIGAASGKCHTVVVTENNNSFSFGWNKNGQLGSGSATNEIESSPVECVATEVKTVACGGEFTVWLSSIEGATILTAGLPQYGQLGHGTDNEYNSKSSSVKLVYEAQPRPKAIASLAKQTIVKVACGTNHTVAVDSDGYVYTWGFGGYGRLGHKVQKDEWTPRLVEFFTKHNMVPPNAIVSAGSLTSSCIAGGGQLYMWGKVKNSGDDWMYPKPIIDLSGWNIRCMQSGSMHHFVGADSSCISWGQAQSGELGYGPNDNKTSAFPKKVDILEGMHVISVACGFAHSMVVVDRINVVDRLDQLEVYDGKAAEEESEHPNSKTPAVKRPIKKAADRTSDKKTNKRKTEDSSKRSEEEKRESDDESDDNHVNGKAENKWKRGGKAASKSAEKVGSVKDRGPPKKTTKGNEKPLASEGNVKTPGKRGRPSKV